VRAISILALAVVVGCARSAADHESLGDGLYAAGQYPDALAEYQLGLKAAPGNASLHAKAAAAALHTQDYGLAADEYRALGVADGSRADEAADGLERVIRLAQQTNDRTALALGLAGLRQLAPARPLGVYARIVALDAAAQGNTADALALLPTAVAAAGDGATADSLLFVYGQMAVRAKDCDTAVPVFEAVIRRQREPMVTDDARTGLAACALLEGQNLLAQGKPGDAEPWFRRATAPGVSGDVIRSAYLGLGDVRLALGDMTGALDAYQQALTGGAADDSLGRAAQSKINALGRATSPDQPQSP
jgi:tetratricopeptide (TPR) repeat protein